MDAIRIVTTIEQDGSLHLVNLPLTPGQQVEVLLLVASPPTQRPPLTADRLRNSGLIGLWADRDDLGASTTFARQLREQAQQRKRD